MQITLNQDEIESALIQYVTSTIMIDESYEVSVDLKAGRGEHGYAATLDITKSETAAPEVAPKKIRASKKAVDVVVEEEPESETEVPEEQAEEAVAEAKLEQEDGSEEATAGSIFNFQKA